MGRRALVLGRIDVRERYEDEGRSFRTVGSIGTEKKIETDSHSGGVWVTVAHSSSMLRRNGFDFERSL